MNEQTFYRNGDTYISNARAIIAGTTFAIHGLATVHTAVEKKRNLWPGILTFFAGCLAAAAANSGVVFGICTLLALVIMIIMRPVAIYKIMAMTQGKEFGMLVTKDREEAEKIMDALNAAIVAQAK